MFSKILNRVKVDKFVASCKLLHSKPDFTKNNYKVTRGNYNYLHDEHFNFFKSILGEKRVITDLSDLEKYNVDWFKNLRGASTVVLKPKTTDEVSKLLKFCNNNRLAVCLQGGNTGVLGGGVPVFDEVIITTELMNNIINLDETSGILICESGCILQNLDTFLAEKGLMVPLDLGAKGSCFIGGNLSTNAGGIRLIRYGNLHGNVLGVEVVKANGEVIDLLSTLKKDNTGYHLKHLFIGSEGTLGLITKVAIQCPARPKTCNVAFLGLQNFEKVMKTFKKARTDLAEILSAVELLDASTMQFMYDNEKVESPIGKYPFYMLIETSGSDEEHDQDKLNKFLETALNGHFILNGTVASDPSKIQDIWNIREKIPESFRKDGYVVCLDVSLPLKHYYQVVEETREHFKSRVKRVFGFGHLGDSNLHIQITTEKPDTAFQEEIETFVFNRTRELNGSISAEHGIGFLKGEFLKQVKSENSLKLMRDLKQLLDPNGILNPYKVLV